MYRKDIPNCQVCDSIGGYATALIDKVTPSTFVATPSNPACRPRTRRVYTKRAGSDKDRGKKKRAKVVNGDGQEVFEVSHIVEERVGEDGREYLVRWKNYSAKDNSWEPAATVERLESVMHDCRERY